jgi:4-hydroxymandelate oxidase
VSALDSLRTVADFERRAREVLPPSTFDSMFGTDGDPEWSALTSNLRGFEKLKLRPRVLTGAGKRSLGASLLGSDVSFPVVVGPTGGQISFGPEGELPTVRAAGSAGTLYVNPCLSTQPLDAIAEAATGPFWAQVWIFTNRSVTEFLVRRAEEVGAGAIVVTVSNAGAPYWSSRRLSGTHVAPHGAGRETETPASALTGFDGTRPSRRELTASIDPGATWADIDWIRSLTSLPVVIKGIQTAEDAAIAVERGIDAVVISDHGGRFLQSNRGTIEILPEVVEAVGPAVEVYVDGGVRRGTDVVAALALGARAVWIGRAALWGLVAGGEEGVLRVLELLREELDATLGLCGIDDVASVGRSAVHEPA